MALFILIAAILIFFQLFQASLRYTASAQQRQMVGLLADRAVEQMRGYSESYSGGFYGFDQWNLYANADLPAPDMPGFRLHVDSQTMGMYNPSRSAEGFQTRPRFMDCAHLVTITVSDASSGTALSSFLGVIGEPPKDLDAALPLAVKITVVSASDPLGRSDTAEYSVQLVKSNGDRVHAPQFKWTLRAGKGNGTLTQDPDGANCKFKNQLDLPGQTTQFTGGSVVLEASTTYRGKKYAGLTPSLNLSP